jgi:HK97 family phage portal protein
MVTEFIARNIAQVGLHAFTKDDNDDRTRLPADRRLTRLLKSPSPVATPYDFQHDMALDLCLWERFAALIVEKNGELELVRLPPNMWKFTRDYLHRPRSICRVKADKSIVEVPLSECLWFDGYPDAGPSPMQSLADLLAEERESSKYRRELWENGGRWPGWLERPADAPPWSTPREPGGKSGRDRFKEALDEYAAGGDRAGKIPLWEDGIKYHEAQYGITPESGQQLETRKFSIAEVSSFFHLPPVFAGLLDDANYSNVNAYREILYNDVLGTWFQRIQQGYNARLLPHPLVVAAMLDYVEFNVGEKLRMSFDQQAKIFQTATGGPIMTRNEARKRLNLPELDGADELIVPMNVTEGGQASPTDSGTQNEE